MSFTCLRTQQRLAAAMVVALGLPAISACAGSSPASTPLPAGVSAVHSASKTSGSGYSFQTINAPADPTTEVLGINNLSKLCGYYGNPSIGFVARPPYAPTKFIK